MGEPIAPQPSRFYMHDRRLLERLRSSRRQLRTVRVLRDICCRLNQHGPRVCLPDIKAGGKLRYQVAGAATFVAFPHAKPSTFKLTQIIHRGERKERREGWTKEFRWSKSSGKAHGPEHNV